MSGATFFNPTFIYASPSLIPISDCLGALCQWYCDGVRGDGKKPNCCMRMLAPMLSVVQAQGSKGACPELCIASLPLVGGVYVLLLWNVKVPPSIVAQRKRHEAEKAAKLNKTQIVPDTGNAK